LINESHLKNSCEIWVGGIEYSLGINVKKFQMNDVYPCELFKYQKMSVFIIDVLNIYINVFFLALKSPKILIFVSSTDTREIGGWGWWFFQFWKTIEGNGVVWMTSSFEYSYVSIRLVLCFGCWLVYVGWRLGLGH